MSNICIGITGGIGSGKSYVCKMLEQRGIPVFYTDDEAKAEMRDNASIHQELTDLIGPQALDEHRRPVKAVLSRYICESTDNAAKVNAIVHPKVKDRTRRWIDAHRHQSIIAIECALLFESGFDSMCDKTVTVSAPLDIRVRRICQRDGITPQKATEWISLQMPQEEKARRSDYNIDNDGQQKLTPQIDEIIFSATQGGIDSKKTC